MSTNARIGFEQENGCIISISCQHDGYLNRMGRTLLRHYNSAELAQKTYQYGNLSTLCPKMDRDVESWMNGMLNFSIYGNGGGGWFYRDVWADRGKNNEAQFNKLTEETIKDR